MKVLMVGQLPKEIGGNYTTGAANVIYELSKKKVEGVSLFTFGTNISDKNAQIHSSYKYQYLGYRFIIFSILSDIIRHPLKTISEWEHYIKLDHANPFRYALYKANIKKAIQVVSPDVIHVHSIGNISPVRYALGNLRIPVLLTCHGIFYRGNPSDFVQRDRHLGNINLADYYSGLTKESLDEYENILGIDRSKVSIIPNGVDCKKFYFNLDSRISLRKEYELSDDTTVFITVASVQERKGQFAFIKVLEKLPLDFQYWIIGDGPDVNAIQNYIHQKKLYNIKLFGYRSSDELYKFYSAADIYAHVSLKEGQALCEIEANATGLRTIVNKQIVGTIPDLEAGDYFVFDPGNIDEDNLVNWINNNKQTRISKTSLDWQVIAEKYVELYKYILIDYRK